MRSVVYREVLGFRPLELDLYLPPGGGPAPVIVYLHGGGWRRGSRHQVLPALGEDFYGRLAARGFVVAAVDYRLSGEATFPAPLDDVRAAIAWLREQALGDRLFLWGESAGGHLALLAALDAGAVDAGVDAGVDGVVAWFPVTDLLAMSDRSADSREAQLLGAVPDDVTDLASAASPVSYARADAPAILLMHGDADDMVPPAQSERLHAALCDAGARVELDIVPGARHMWHDAGDVPGIVERSVQFLQAI